MNRVGALALGLLLQGGPVAVAPSRATPDSFESNLLAIGYHVATLADFVGKPGYAQRLHDPAGYLAFSADFSGDGRRGEARILLNPVRGNAYVVVSLASKTTIDTYVIRIYDLESINHIGIRKAMPAEPGSLKSGITIFGLDDFSFHTFDYSPDEFVMRSHDDNAYRKAGT